MAIPPISNNPLLKLFRTDQQDTDNKAENKDQKSGPAATGTAESRQDIVEISAAAQQRLDNVRELSNEEARETAAETRDILENSAYALGREPNNG